MRYGFNYGQHLLEMMGSFWTVVYQDQGFMHKYVDGLSKVMSQTYFTFLKSVLLSSLKDMPILRTERWKLLTFKLSELNKNSATVLKLGGSPAFNGQSAKLGPQPPDTEYLEGEVFQLGGFALGKYFAFALPEDMVDVEAYLTNRIYSPSLIWSKGTDFQVAKEVLIFAKNPFDEPLIPKRNIYDENGTIIDQEIALWAYDAKFDKEDLWKQYGYLLDTRFESTENYRDFIRSALGLFMIGPKVNSLIGMLSALFGLPIIRETSEVVTQIQPQGDSTIIQTDSHQYTLRSDIPLHPDVVVGASLPLFSPLSNTINILDNSIQPNWWRNYNLLPLPVQILNSEYRSSLVVRNKYTKFNLIWGNTFKFEAEGEMSDSQRDTFNNFPITWGSNTNWGDDEGRINFLDFVFSNVINDNLFLLTVQTNHIILERLTSQAIELFNEAIPANVFMIGLLNYDLDSDYETDRIEDELEHERGHHLDDTIELNTRVESGRFSFIVWGSGLNWNNPAEGYWGSRAFQPSIAVLKRYTKCQ